LRFYVSVRARALADMQWNENGTEKLGQKNDKIRNLSVPIFLSNFFQCWLRFYG